LGNEVKLGKIFKIFKKGSKLAGKKKGQKPAGGFDWPSGVRIGVFGHTNSGKTVYFTVLNEECKVSRGLQLSVTDNATAGEFLKNYRAIWGLGTSNEVGTVVDLQGEKQFPNPSTKDRLLQFNAILDGDKNLPIIAVDYPGAAVSISEPSDLKDKITDFMDGCDGLMFFFDTKILQAELTTQAHVASFVNMIERLAPLGSRLPIPVSLVITKADTLEGFSSDDQVALISEEDENLLSENFELFLERTLAGSKLSGNPAWSGSVRTVLVKLREFLKVVVGRTLDFQVFFTSCTGSTPEKIGTDVGRSIYRPPERMAPIGVREPFEWLLRSLVRNRSISRLRGIAKFVATLSVIWIIVFSIPFLFHFFYLLPQAERVEENILEAYDGNYYNTNSEERARIISTYGRYQRSWTVKWFFPRFQPPAGRIRDKYGDFNLAEEIKRLDQVLGRFSVIVQDSTLWPKLNPSDTTIIENDEHAALLTDLERFRVGDSTAILFTRSDRAIKYWGLFKEFIAHRGDSTFYNAIAEQVQFDSRTLADDLSQGERDLGVALRDNLKVRAAKRQQKEVAQKAAVELDDLFDQINGNEDPTYRLGDAVTELRRIRRQLDPTVDAENIAAIRSYLQAAEKFDKSRKYTYKVEAVPAQGHLHLEVTTDGSDPTWSEQSQIIEGFNYSLHWKKGDDIHLALDTLGAPEHWGKNASDKKILKTRFSIFEMDGEVSFDNLGQKVSIRFVPNLADGLPTLKK
jgi:hypothetical protein